MGRIQIQDFFPFFVSREGEGGGSARGGVGRGVGAIIFNCETPYPSNIHCVTCL